MALSLGAIGLVALLAMVFLPKVDVDSLSVGNKTDDYELNENSGLKNTESVAISSSESSRPKSTIRVRYTPLNGDTVSGDNGGNNRSDKERHGRIASFSAGAFLGATAGSSDDIKEGVQDGVKWGVIVLFCVVGYLIYRKVK